MRARHKKWALPYLEEHPEFVLFDVKKASFADKTLALEIGAGKGDFALALATSNPSLMVLALERDSSIAGIFAKKIEESQLKNLFLSPLDFDEAFSDLAPLRFQTIYLNFSDPWPKKKHWKRRLTTRERLKEMASLLAPKGQICFKSDNDSLYEFTQEEASEAGLKIVSKADDYVFDASSDYMSEYERNFRSQGVKIHRLVLVKEEKE